MLVQMTGALME